MEKESKKSKAKHEVWIDEKNKVLSFYDTFGYNKKKFRGQKSMMEFTIIKVEEGYKLQ